ncbi:MAG: PAS domain-containing protein [Acetobacterium sp.]
MIRMNKGSEKSDDIASKSQELRRQAEDLTTGQDYCSAKDLSSMSLAEVEKVMHELEVHQIELELQNEELRRANLEVDRVRARYFDLYDMAPVGYCTISEEGEILESNFTLSTLLGRTRGALKGQIISNFIYSEDQDIYYLSSNRLFETKAPQECELRLLKEDGSFIWINLAAIAVSDEEGDFEFRVVVKDITERKNIEYLLCASEKKYRLITENVSSVVSVYNIKKDQYSYISPSIFKLRGITVEEAMKETIEESLTPESLVYEREDLAKSLIEFIRDPENPKDYTSEIQQYCKNGDIIWVQSAKKYRFNEDGDIEIVGLSRDVTDRVHAISDTYDGMLENDTYRTIYNSDDSVNDLKRDKSKEYDLEMVKDFLKNRKK